MIIEDGASPADLRECAQMMASTDPWIRLERNIDQCLAAVSHDDARLLTARGGDQILGFLVYNMRVGIFRGYIQTLCVAESARGQGVGTTLIQAGEQRIFKESPNVFICVSSFNVRAKRLYERLGYVEVGEFPDIVVRSHSEFLLRKTTGPLSEFARS